MSGEARDTARTSIRILRTCPRCRHRNYHWARRVDRKVDVQCCDCGHAWAARWLREDWD